MLRRNLSTLFPRATQILRCENRSPFTSRVASAPAGEASRMLAKHFNEQVNTAEQSRTPEQLASSNKAANEALKSFKDARHGQEDSNNKTNTADDSARRISNLRKRLMYQSRYRGMAELDLVLGAFAATVLPTITTLHELEEFDAVLRELDTDLFHWLVTVPGRKASAAAGDTVPSHSQQTAQSILAGTSDYPTTPVGGATATTVAGATPTVDDEFVEPKEMLEAEWHRRDEVPEALQKNSMWRRLQEFVEKDRSAIVGYR